MSKLTAQEKSVWAGHIQTQPDSGLTQQSYCQKHNLRPHRFWYWKRKLTGGAGKNPGSSSRARAASAFVPVSILAQEPLQQLSVTLPNGMTVGGIDDRNLLLAQHLIGALK